MSGHPGRLESQLQVVFVASRPPPPNLPMASEAGNTTEVPAAPSVLQEAVLGTLLPEPKQDEFQPTVMCGTCGLQVCENDVQIIGTRKKVYKCNKCNALQSRLNRLFGKQGALAKDWAQLSAEQKQEFMKASGSAAGPELLEAVTSFTRELTSSLVGTNLGDYLPLSVYENRGYSAEALKGIKANAPKLWDPVLCEWTYQLMVRGGGSKDEETTVNSTNWRPGEPKSSAEPGPRSRVRARSGAADAGSSGAATNSAAGTKEAEKEERKRRKAEELQAKKQVQEERRNANKIISLLAPLMLKMKDILHFKMTAAIKEKMPSYIIEESTLALDRLSIIEAAWQKVVQGGSAPEGDDMKAQVCLDYVRSVQEMVRNLQTMFGIAQRA